MDVTRLLPAPMTPSSEEVEATSTSLVPSSNLLPGSHGSSSNSFTGSPYSSDAYVWTASASEDGSFTFYAMPKGSSSQAGGSNAWDNFFSARHSASAWNSMYSSNAIAQYTFYSDLSLTAQGTSQEGGHRLNVYA